ncbi:hypothetical protein WA158_004258 [Blastocystis sp. Blastoise]
MQHLISAETISTELAENLAVLNELFPTLVKDMKHEHEYQNLVLVCQDLVSNKLIPFVQSLNINLIDWIHLLEKTPGYISPGSDVPSIISLDEMNQKATNVNEIIKDLLEKMTTIEDHLKSKKHTINEIFTILQEKIVPKSQNMAIHIIDCINDNNITDEAEIKEMIDENKL